MAVEAMPMVVILNDLEVGVESILAYASLISVKVLCFGIKRFEGKTLNFIFDKITTLQ